MDPVDRRARDVARASKHSKVDEGKGQVELDRKTLNLYIIICRKIKEAKIAEPGNLENSPSLHRHLSWFTSRTNDSLLGLDNGDEAGTRGGPGSL